MKTQRGVSQVVFNLLPEQTLDVSGRVWKVARWVEPRVLPVDLDVVRSELRRVSYPWTAHGLDNGLSERLADDELRVIAPSVDGGVRVEPFPELWYCRQCRRLETSTDKACRCGAHVWVQLAFVAYHDCGRMETPWVPRCTQHHQVRLNLPRSSSTADLKFDCPVCNQPVMKEGGFPFRKCECGNGTYSYNLHRAAVVYTPRSTVIVNPPSAAEAAALKTETGARRVLEWVLDGMELRKPLEGGLTIETLVAKMVAEGIPETAARIAARAVAEQGGGVSEDAPVAPLSLDSNHADVATQAALRLAYATASGRTLAADLADAAGPATKPRYQIKYPAAMSGARLEAVELLEDFPVLNACYGYTRGGKAAGESALRWFRTGSGAPRIHGQLSRTEALLFRLDPMAVIHWLGGRGHGLGATPRDARDARLKVLEIVTMPAAGDDPALDTAGADLLRLVHSYAHRVMRRMASFAGIDRDSLSEYLVPEHLSFAVYATARGDFVLGGLQALFEQDLADALADVLGGEHRCPLDPGCAAHGGACVACLHTGEPSCRVFNQFLDRRVLFGSNGYLSH